MAGQPSVGLQLMSAQSQLILNGLSAGVLLLDRNGRAVFLNPAAEQILGCSQQHGLGQKSADLFRHCPGLAKLVERALDNQQPHTLSGVSVEPGPGQPGAHLIDCNAVPVDIESGGGLLIELVDVTRREKISRENALLEQHGVSRTMIRQLAHEIRNPLGGLRGAAQLLERRLGDKATKEYTSVIISEADRLAALVDTLLGPEQAPQKASVSIHELIEHVIRLLGVQAGAEVALERDYDPSLPEMMLDRDQIIQALLNLGRNAMQAVGHKGRVIFRTRVLSRFTIGATRHRLVASIEVEDDGVGVAQEISEQIFYPLVSSGTGSGLGLPLAQDLVHRHGGLIEFGSRPGRTVFQMLLPIYTATDKAVETGRGNDGVSTVMRAEVRA